MCDQCRDNADHAMENMRRADEALKEMGKDEIVRQLVPLSLDARVMSLSNEIKGRMEQAKDDDIDGVSTAQKEALCFDGMLTQLVMAITLNVIAHAFETGMGIFRMKDQTVGGPEGMLQLPNLMDLGTKEIHRILGMENPDEEVH